jgi:CRP/FNR family transcriptional regulator, polysaccharide utilization system transcription regulator
VSSQPMPGKFSSGLLQALRGLNPVQRFPKGAPLFQQGSPATGVYLVERGEVRVLLPLGKNRRQLLEIVGPGNLLGLRESMCGETYRVCAESTDETMAVFVPREELLKFFREHGDFCMEVVRLLSEDLHGLYDKFRTISAHPGRPRQRPPHEQLN